MELAVHIASALLHHQQCTLPGIGSFRLEAKPAALNIADKKIKAPSQQIIFQADSEATNDDFVNYVAQRENIHVSIAQTKVEKFIAQLKELLATGKPVTIPTIGSLQQDPFGNLHFNAFQLIPDLPDEAVECKPVLREQATTRRVGEVEQTGQQAVEYFTPILEKSRHPRRWLIQVLLVLVLSPVVIGLLIYFVFHPAAQKEGPSGAARVIATDTLPPLRPEENEVQTEPSGAASQPVPPADSIQYNVVFATYTHQAKAEKRYKQLKNWGHEVVLFTKDSVHYLLAVPFTSLRADTSARLEAVKKKYGSKAFIVY